MIAWAKFWLITFDVAMHATIVLTALLDWWLPEKYRPSYWLEVPVSQTHDAMWVAFIRNTTR